MLRPISDARRRTLVQVSGCACTAAAVLLLIATPRTFSVRAAEEANEIPVTVPAVSNRIAYPAVDVGHDPFIPLLRVERTAQNGPVSDLLGAGEGPLLRAVVVGESARALLDDNGSISVLSVGDAIGGSTIAAIDRSGIALASGVRIPLTKDGR